MRICSLKSVSHHTAQAACRHSLLQSGRRRQGLPRGAAGAAGGGGAAARSGWVASGSPDGSRAPRSSPSGRINGRSLAASADGVAGEAMRTPPRYTRYPVTPTLSLEADQVSIEFLQHRLHLRAGQHLRYRAGAGSWVSAGHGWQAGASTRSGRR